MGRLSWAEVLTESPKKIEQTSRIELDIRSLKRIFVISLLRFALNLGLFTLRIFVQAKLFRFHRRRKCIELSP